MNLLSRDARAYGLKARVLRLANCIIDLIHLRRCLALQDGASHICIVPAALGARKDVDDNGSIGKKRSRTSRMRVCSLKAAGNNGVHSLAAVLQQRDLNAAAHLFREEGLIMIE